ncbi:MAG: alpha/beta hydrolase [Gammaproteobacteria bacterium]|jgi:pimeloyl-ACP methyl ester carboxylesterase|nr:alpha/beta hydrolase [Gammaproteobacteria bacterium]
MHRSPKPRQWILLRGLTRESAHWGDFAAGLLQALPNDHVLALDLPGNGQLHTVPSPLSVQTMVQACRSELARRAVAPPYHLLAMSLGAMVANEWATAAPGEVAGCVLINTSMRPFSPFYQRLRPHNLVTLLQLMCKWRSQSAGGAEAVEEIILRITSNRAPDRVDVIAPWAAVRRRRPVSPSNALRQLVAAALYRAPAVPPRVPLLLLGSIQDQLVANQCSESIAKAWGVPLHKHPSAGHDLPLDDPQWVINEVLQWAEWTA